MSSAHRSRSQIREDRMAATIRTPEDQAHSVAEGRRQQADLIRSAEADGTITAAQAAVFRAKYGLSI